VRSIGKQIAKDRPGCVLETVVKGCIGQISVCLYQEWVSLIFQMCKWTPLVCRIFEKEYSLQGRQTEKRLAWGYLNAVPKIIALRGWQ
jgi:hypothetical protein